MAEDQQKDGSKDPVTETDAAKDADAKPAKKQKSGARLLLVLISIVVLAFVIAMAGSDYFAKAPSNGAVNSDGTPTVGGPFTLTDTKGETVTDKDFAGKYMLVFFGYTYCPDVCPTALSDMSTALDMLSDAKVSKLTPVFISVDPKRDTPEHLSEYVTFFHPKLVGLTGTEQQIKDVAREYRVFYRLGEPSADDPLDYTVDHTSIVYLIGPDGKLVTHFSHGTTPEAMAERLGQLL